MNTRMLKKIIKFCIVSVSGLLVELGMAAFLLKFFGLEELLHHSFTSLVLGNVHVEIIVVIFVNVMAFILATTTNYYLNRIWTWKSHNPDVSSEYARFFGVSIVGLTLNLIIIYILGTNCNFETIVTGYIIPSLLIVKAIAMIIVTGWNFVANNVFTFRKPNSKDLENAENYCDYTDYKNDDIIDNDDDYIPKP